MKWCSTSRLHRTFAPLYFAQISNILPHFCQVWCSCSGSCGMIYVFMCFFWICFVNLLGFKIKLWRNNVCSLFIRLKHHLETLKINQSSGNNPPQQCGQESLGGSGIVEAVFPSPRLPVDGLIICCKVGILCILVHLENSRIVSEVDSPRRSSSNLPPGVYTCLTKATNAMKEKKNKIFNQAWQARLAQSGRTILFSAREK